MIDFLTGSVEELRENYALISVNGVGYGVNISVFTHDRIKGAETASLFTYTNVREDAIELYGFHDREEKAMFVMLISVNGIGPKAAMNILSGMQVPALKKAIASGDRASLTRIPGLGAKKSERVIIELKDKLKEFAAESVSGEGEDAPEEYVQALTGLGFNYNQAREAIRAAMKSEPGAAQEVIIKQALRRLGR